MIRYFKHPLLLPVNKKFIWLSILVALVVDIIPLGPVLWRPSLTLVVIMFWSLHHSNVVSIAVALCCGLLLDVHFQITLGTYGLIFCSASFIMQLFINRLQQYKSSEQAVQLLPIFFVLEFMRILLNLLQHGNLPSWSFLITPFLEAILWVFLDFILLLSQRRLLAKEKNRV